MKECINVNQGGYNEFIDLSKKINEFKSKQEEAFTKFLEFKKEFSLINNTLKEKLLESNIIQGNLEKQKLDMQERRKLREEQILEEKAKQVEEKLKQGKKLTTQDLIIMQGRNG